MTRSPGNQFVGFVNVNGGDQLLLVEHGLPRLGKWSELPEIITRHQVEEAIVAVESSEHDHISRIVNELEVRGPHQDHSGHVRHPGRFGEDVQHLRRTPHRGEPGDRTGLAILLKRIIDIAVSILALMLLSPLMLVIALLVKVSSPGPVFFRQERVGKNGKPLPDREVPDMYTDAEERSAPEQFHGSAHHPRRALAATCPHG